MKSIEQFIRNNRDEFDSDEMKIGWDTIEKRIKQKKTNSTRRYLLSAAACITIFIFGAVFYHSITTTKTDTVIEKTIDVPSKQLTDDVDPAYTFQMDQFIKLISLKQNELKENQKTHPLLYEQFIRDNNHLDSSYNYLKSELSANPNKEILLDAMIQNLQLKLDLLSRQLQIIKQSKLKKTNNEKTI